MAINYDKTTWTKGTTLLSADNMNHIENGIKANADVAHSHGNATVLDGLTSAEVSAWNASLYIDSDGYICLKEA